MNSTSAKFKMSKIEKETNKQIVIVFFVQVIICFTSAIIGVFMQFDLLPSDYLGFGRDTTHATDTAYDIIKKTGTWILIFT